MKQRIVGLDLARALAVIGMVIVNFKVVMHASAADAPWWLALVDALDGRASAVFVVLAGVGLSLISQRARQSGDTGALHAARAGILKRAAFLFVAGLLYVQVWPADILHYYGAYMAIGAAVLSWRTGALFAAALAMVAGFVLLATVIDYGAGWNWDTLAYAGFWGPAGFVRNLFFNGFHPVFPWAGFLLLGMAAGRFDLQSNAMLYRIFMTGLGMGIAAEAAMLSGALWATPGAGIWAHLWSSGPLPPLPLYWIAAAGDALALIAACVWIGERWRSARPLAPLVHTGQLALTLYIAHVVIGMGVLEALGLLEGRTLAFAVASALLFSAGAVLCAHLWRRRFALGPVEWLMRRCTGL
ncbi:DUF418 domain-containing protein [Massilia sp. P8910]|uniref:DUF418 domain-containing protein n=1 Tax=Massilia antarctica TaxID=2765360 RepID=UPI001E4CB02D|nr:DUF418 domain-containing protein [Massilia antarctica]MCE3602023.1 DUF418 domain-containing protein [Massilia antarctica]